MKRYRKEVKTRKKTITRGWDNMSRMRHEELLMRQYGHYNLRQRSALR